MRALDSVGSTVCSKALAANKFGKLAAQYGMKLLGSAGSESSWYWRHDHDRDQDTVRAFQALACAYVCFLCPHQNFKRLHIDR